MLLRQGFTPDYFNRFGSEYLPELVGLVTTKVSEGVLRGELLLRKALVAPNGFLAAGTIVTLADTLAGYACIAHLPAGAQNFTTIELKSNFLGTAKEGIVQCDVHAAHLGRTTHVWDAFVTQPSTDKRLCLFRCTQLLLYAKGA